MNKIIINSLDDFLKFAKNFSKSLKPGDIVALCGLLGAGKTTLVQRVALELGISSNVASPTFTIMKEYAVPKNAKGIKNMRHIDAYRLKGSFDDIGLEECFKDNDSVCFIEWADKIKPLLPKHAIWIIIKIKKDGSRLIKSSSRYFRATGWA